jgi:hypothetical protein
VVVGFVGPHTCAALALARKCRCVEVAPQPVSNCKVSFTTCSSNLSQVFTIFS